MEYLLAIGKTLKCATSSLSAATPTLEIIACSATRFLALHSPNFFDI